MEAPLPMPCKDADRSNLIAAEATLSAAIQGAGNVVGVDTEFLRERTFFPIPAIYQIAGAGGVHLVDARVEHSFNALKALLADPRRVKVMHACSEDLEVMDRHLAAAPVNLADTQVAHAFLNPELSISYAALVQAHLGIALDKRQTRSNWLKRPLSREQLQYAREDVAHLPAIWARLREGLTAAGRMGWYAEEMAAVLRRAGASRDDDYREIKGARRLSPKQLGALRRLAQWRERQARRRDLPRRRVLDDDQLLSLAQLPTPSKACIVRALPPRTARRFGDELLRECSRAWEEDEPPAPLPAPLSRRQGQLLQALRGFVEARAEALGMAPGLLGAKRMLQEFVRAGTAAEATLGWRREALGEGFTAVLREHRA